MKRSLLLMVLLAAGLAAGCARSRVKTSTGLPYWPPGTHPGEEAPTSQLTPKPAVATPSVRTA